MEKINTNGEVVNPEKESNEKLSYEQLYEFAVKLRNDNNTLIERCKELTTNIQELNSIFNRLSFLFKVVEYSAKFNSDFVIKCTDEIESLITLPEVKEEETNNAESRN